MKELTSLRRQRGEVSERIHKRTERIPQERLAVEKGGDPRELRLLEEDQESDRATLASLERRIGAFEQEEARVRDLALAVEQDAFVEEAHAQRVAAWAEANDEFDTIAHRLLALDDAFQAAANGFLQTTGRLAPFGHDQASRDKIDALREQLLARGAKLAAINTTYRHHAFTIAAGGALALPEPWGALLEQALNGLYSARAYQQEREERERLTTHTGASV